MTEAQQNRLQRILAMLLLFVLVLPSAVPLSAIAISEAPQNVTSTAINFTIPRIIVGENAIPDLSRVDWDMQVNVSSTMVALNSDVALALLNIPSSTRELVRGYRNAVVAIDSKPPLSSTQKAEQKLHKKQALQHLIAEALIKSGDLPANYFELQSHGAIQPADRLVNVTKSSARRSIPDGVGVESVSKGQLVNGTTLKPPAIDKGIINSAHDAQAWRNYYDARLQYLKSQKGISKEVIKSAEYAKERFESYLLDKNYIDSPGAAIESPGISLKGIMKWLFGWLLPENVYAFVFGTEDFESCASLPCSFTSNSSWGSASSSIDDTSKIDGSKSLKVVMNGEGGGSLTKTGLNTSDIRVQFKIKVPDPITYGASGFFTILMLKDGSNNDRLWLNVENVSSTSRLTVTGDVLSFTNTGVDLMEGAINTIELRAKTGSSSGTVQIWVNNNSENAPDYDSGNVNIGTVNFDKVVAGLVYAPESGIPVTYFDNIVANNSFIGASANGAPIGPSTSTINGLEYLLDNQNPDGSWGSATTSLITTAVVLDTLRLLHATGTGYANGVEWIDSYIADNNDYLSEQAKALVDSGAATSTVETLVYALDEDTGGFIFDRGYEPDSLTTAKALEALTSAGYEDLGSNPNLTVSMGLYYLANSQRSNGTWGIFEDGASSISATTEVLESMLPYRNWTLTGLESGDIVIEDYIDDAISALRNLQNASGTWGDNVLKTALTFYALKSAGVTPLYQNAAITYLQNQQDGDGGFGGNIYTTAQAVKALSVAPSAGAIGDADVTDIEPLTSLYTGSSTTLRVTVANHGNAPISSGILRVMADGYSIGSVDLAAQSINFGASSTATIDYSLSNTWGFVGDVDFTAYLEGADGIGYQDSRYDETLTFAAEPSGLPGLPIYFVAQKHVASSSPAMSVWWKFKDDPNRLKYLIMWRTTGSSTWSGVDINNAWSGAFVWPFAEDQLYDVTVGAVAQDNTRIVYYDDSVQLLTSSNNLKYATSTISGLVSAAGQPVPDVPLYGYSVSGTSDENGDYLIGDIRYGASAFHVDDFRYEPYWVRFDNGGDDLSGIAVPTLPKPDTENPVVTDLSPYVYSSYVVPNKQSVTFHYTVSDDVGNNASGTVQSAKFEYYDPNDSQWHMIGTQEGEISHTWTYNWTIPENLIGENYQMRVTVRDFSGKDSTPAVYGPFEITEGNGPPTFSFNAPGAGSGGSADLSYTVKWTAHDPDDNATIYLYYDVDQNANNGGNISITTKHTDDLLTQYEWDTSAISEGTYYIHAIVTDEYNTSLVVTSPPIVMTHMAPTAPTDLLMQGETNPENVYDTSYRFSAVYNDPSSTDSAAYYQIQIATSTTFVGLAITPMWDSGKTELSETVAENSRTEDILYSGPGLPTSTTLYWRIKLWDNDGNEGKWSPGMDTFSIAGSDNAPTPPTSLLTEGATNPTIVTSTTPHFSAIYNDPNDADRANAYWLQVSTSSVFTSTFWISGTSTMATTTVGDRSPELTYGGPALLTNTTYYWRILFVDIWGLSGQWSTATSTFMIPETESPYVEISDGSILALYHFNNQNVNDSGPYGRNGTDGSTPMQYTSTSTKLGDYAASTGGGSSYFTSVSSTMDLSSDYSIGFWMQPKESFNDGVYIIWRNILSGAQEGFSYSIACTANYLEFVHQSSCRGNVGQTFNTGTWYWILAERHGTSFDFYVNNSLVQHTTDSYTSNADAIVNFNGYVTHSGGMKKMLLDEIFFTTSAISTSTRDALYNDGDGKEICTTSGCGFSVAFSFTEGTLGQYKLDGTTAIPSNGSTTENGVFFKGTLNSTATSSVQLQIEVKSSGVAFTNIANSTSSFMSPGSMATTTIHDLSPGNYHWQARIVDALGHSSSWVTPTTPSSTIDFVIEGEEQEGVYIATPLAIYHFDSNLADATANSYDMSWHQGSSTPSYVSGKFSNALQTSKTGGSYAYVNSNMGITGSSVFMSAWGKLLQLPDSNTRHGFVANQDAGTNIKYTISALSINGTQSIIFTRRQEGVTECDVRYDTNIGTSNWHLFNLAWNSSTNVLTGYIDGSPVGTTSCSGNGTASTNSITSAGRIFDGAGDANNGSWNIDDFGIWAGVSNPSSSVSSIWNGGDGLMLLSN